PRPVRADLRGTQRDPPADVLPGRRAGGLHHRDPPLGGRSLARGPGRDEPGERRGVHLRRRLEPPRSDHRAPDPAGPRRALECATTLGLAACVPTPPDLTSIVDSPRMLAVQVDPPEQKAATTVDLHGFYADATGQLAAADIDWAFCKIRKPLAEPGPIATTC